LRAPHAKIQRYWYYKNENRLNASKCRCRLMLPDIMATIQQTNPTFSVRGKGRGCAPLWLAFVLAAAAIAPAQAQTATETILHSFSPEPPKGATPYAGVIRDAAGNLYGTTYEGGAWNQGVVYKVTPSGQETLLHSFTGGADGANPAAGVIADSAGNLYGTTLYGGAAPANKGSGVVYKLNPSGQETVLYTFSGGADGKWPFAGVIRDSTGNLYGTTSEGGADDGGVVYELDLSGQETVLYSFTGASGSGPNAGVIRDAAGNLYGTTVYGGTGSGVVYKLNTSGQETVLYTFTGGADGMWPSAGVIQDSAGNLYGTTQGGGSTGYGVVYKLDPAGRETVLYSFKGGTDGGSPFAGVIRDPAGNLYGTTLYGGIGVPCDGGCGVVFKLDTSSHETALYAFTGYDDGGAPDAGVIEDSAGNLYGTASTGNLANYGVVYKLDSAGQQSVLYAFPFGTDGENPEGGVIRDSAGNIYGTTYQGGTGGAGTVFKLDPTGRETVLHNFTGLGDGGYPQSNLILDSSGNLYGTARAGSGRAGVVFKVDTTGNETVLYSFTGGDDGRNPLGGVVFDSAGNLYGTTKAGGFANAGTVFKLNPAGQETVLYNFRGGADGHSPIAGVILDSAGNLYGTTSAGGAANAGVVYMVSPAGQETVLYSFTGGADGSLPYAGVVRDAASNLFGTTLEGGAGGHGVVYELDTAGQETVLHNFGNGADGGSPHAGLIFDASGNLIGTADYGGTVGAGVVFKVDLAGNETVLYNFTNGDDGGFPLAGVILDSSGDLYGTTYRGGNQRSGVVFKLTPQ
jgi:uncharacterized repeat protein (TIGR03803 family)